MSASSDDDDDALLDALETSTENDPTLQHLREARLQQLSQELKAAHHQRRAGYGRYTDLADEKEVLEITAAAPRSVVHFSSADFPRCRIMDGHLSALAGRYLTTRFVKIEAARAPFLVAKLQVRVLPCVIGFVGGVRADRIVGFEGVGGGGDTFGTGDLERRLVGAGVLEEGKGKGKGLGGGLGESCEKERGGGKGDGDDDDDKDDDDDDEWD
ncbi:MAG: hypothetical protein Q9161_001865 [Pseudevernia consocians]